MWAASGILGDLTEWLKDLSGNWWFLAAIFLVAVFDSVIPIVPSETTVIVGGVAASAAGTASYPVWLVILCGAAGAFVGDNMSYQIGLRASGWMARRAEKRPATAERLAWASRQIQLRGGLLLITARFVPGGRTALTLSCGVTRQPARWFATWVAVAALVWASYAALLGYVFGERFEDNHTLAFLLAFGASLVVTMLIEVFRWMRRRRQERLAERLLSASRDDGVVGG
ncbi:MAG: DedA family protein [Ilumatobacteraceae bacterium]|nr:MAG: DedA family protein [Actinomycetota bacterium]